MFVLFYDGVFGSGLPFNFEATEPSKEIVESADSCIQMVERILPQIDEKTWQRWVTLRGKRLPCSRLDKDNCESRPDCLLSEKGICGSKRPLDCHEAGLLCVTQLPIRVRRRGLQDPDRMLFFWGQQELQEEAIKVPDGLNLMKWPGIGCLCMH